MNNVVQKLKTKLGAGARTNLFRAYIFFPFATPSLDADSYVLINKVEIPEVKIETPLKVIFQGGHEIKFGAVNRLFPTMTLTIINDVNFSWRKELERYIEFISGWAAETKAEPEEYERDLIIENVGLKGEVLRRYTLKYAFPTGVSNITLNADQEDIQKYDVTFEYQGITFE